MRFLLNQRGDTLVEVTMALAILSSVLTVSYVTANRAFGVVQTARERTQLVSEAQGQAEALRDFRDNRSWNDFKVAISQNATGDCPAGSGESARCFHMEQQANTGEWLPKPGFGSPAVFQTKIPGTYFGIVAQPASASGPNSMRLTIWYGAIARGAAASVANDKTSLGSNLTLWLNNHDSALNGGGL